MELRIETPMVPGVLPEIQWNNEELKKEIAEKAAEYKSIAYTDAQSADMKKDRAKLNSLVTAFENERKRVKKFYQEPYEKFEAQVKDILQPAREAIVLIDNGLSEIEQKYRADKTAKMRQFYEQYVGDLRKLVPFDRTVKQEFYKRAFTDKKLEQAFIDFFTRIQSDISNIEGLDTKYKDKILLEYAKSFNIGDALREGKRLEDLEKVMAERNKKQEEQRIQNEQRVVNAQVSVEKTQENSIAKPVQKQEEQKITQENKEQIMQLDFRVWGTSSQLMGLRQYMIDSGIKFGKVV